MGQVMASDLARRVASRVAKDFPTEKALQDYLKDHPKADPKRHNVTEDGGAPPPEEGGGKPKPKLKQPSKKPKVVLPPAKGEGKSKDDVVVPQAEKPAERKSIFKGLSERAQKMADGLKKGAKQFVVDPEFRKKALKGAVGAIAKSPAVYAGRLKEAVKHEAHEVKLASEGVGAVLKGGKMSKKQKKAFKTVATHMAITATAAAFAGTGLGAAGAFGKAIARQIAAKAVSNSMENIHTLDELGHIGHGLVDILSKIAAEEDGKAEETNEHKMAMLVLAAVTKEIHAMDDDLIKAALEDAAGDGESKEAALAYRVATRYQAATGSPDPDEVEEWFEYLDPGSQRSVMRQLKHFSRPPWNAREWEQIIDYYVQVVEGDPRGWQRSRNI